MNNGFVNDLTAAPVRSNFAIEKLVAAHLFSLHVKANSSAFGSFFGVGTMGEVSASFSMTASRCSYCATNSSIVFEVEFAFLETRYGVLTGPRGVLASIMKRGLPVSR
jgi:hypothetical protein